jgi:hypothetical protein
VAGGQWLGDNSDTKYIPKNASTQHLALLAAEMLQSDTETIDDALHRLANSKREHAKLSELAETLEGECDEEDLYGIKKEDWITRFNLEKRLQSKMKRPAAERKTKR